MISKYSYNTLKYNKITYHTNFYYIKLSNNNKLLLRQCHSHKNSNVYLTNTSNDKLKYSFDYSLYIKNMEETLIENNKIKDKIEEYNININTIDINIKNIDYQIDTLNNTVESNDKKLNEEIVKLKNNVDYLKDKTHNLYMNLFTTQIVCIIMYLSNFY